MSFTSTDQINQFSDDRNGTLSLSEVSMKFSQFNLAKVKQNQKKGRYQFAISNWAEVAYFEIEQRSSKAEWFLKTIRDNYEQSFLSLKLSNSMEGVLLISNLRISSTEKVFLDKLHTVICKTCILHLTKGQQSTFIFFNSNDLP